MTLPIGQIINADCLEVMRSWPDKCVDVVITDPPYGIGIAKNPFRQKFAKSNWDNRPCSQEEIEEMLRISKNQIIWGGNYFPLPPSQCFLIWDKGQPEDFSSAMCEMAWTSFKSPAKTFFKRVTEYAKVHPTQKPLELMKWCIEKYTKPTDLILDCFAGSGTTCVAAELLGRKWIGIELDETYCQIARKRVKEAKEQFALLEMGK
jgi:site-specific DNA-methyltransferase (adenine-specific)